MSRFYGSLCSMKGEENNINQTRYTVFDINKCMAKERQTRRKKRSKLLH